MSNLTPEDRRKLDLALHSQLTSKDPKERAAAVAAVNDVIELQLRRTRLMVSLDGGQSWQPAEEGVRVVYQDLECEDSDARVLLNCTHEGLVLDLLDDDDVLGTSSETYEELVQRLRPKE